MEVLRAYADDMNESCNQSEERHDSLQLSRCQQWVMWDSCKQNTYETCVCQVMCHLEGTDYYSPILVDADLSVSDKFARYLFFNNLNSLAVLIFMCILLAVNLVLYTIFGIYQMQKKIGLCKNIIQWYLRWKVLSQYTHHELCERDFMINTSMWKSLHQRYCETWWLYFRITKFRDRQTSWDNAQWSRCWFGHGQERTESWKTITLWSIMERKWMLY